MSNLVSTSRSDFMYFEKCVRKWVRKLGLTAWDVTVCLGDTDADSMAECLCHLQQNSATISLSSVARRNYEFQTKHKWTKREIEATALHEVLEMKYSRIRSFASQGISETLVDEEIHRLIQLDINHLLPLK